MAVSGLELLLLKVKATHQASSATRCHKRFEKIPANWRSSRKLMLSASTLLLTWCESGVAAAAAAADDDDDDDDDGAKFVGFCKRVMLRFWSFGVNRIKSMMAFKRKTLKGEIPRQPLRTFKLANF